MHDIFNALKLCSYAGVRAVILGQDPYHGDGQAHGLSFSVKKGVAIPPSLHNIYKELESDTGLSPPSHGELTDWASSGALLLNSILTVRAHEPTSHKQIGWEAFTDRIISLLNEREAPAVFILWGAYAQSKGKLITNSRHLILSSPHPSPLSASRGFFGSKPFSRANEFLRSIGNDPIDWAIKEL
jgi:uracil-DNA glycosylase